MPILDQLRHGVDLTKFKADQALRINRIQNEIGELRREILGIRDKIANAALALHKQNALSIPELEELCAAIDQVEVRIAEKEVQINGIRAEIPPQTAARPATLSNQPTTPCPHCKFNAPWGATFCPNCGKSIVVQPPEPSADVTPASNITKCASCGFLLPVSAAFCPECGKPIAP